MALILFFGKFIGAFTPLVTEFCEQKGIHILVGCGILIFASLPATFMLEETLVEGEGNGKKTNPCYKVVKRKTPLDLRVSNDDYVEHNDSREFDTEGGEIDPDLIF